jgi:dienelactone hydrolase
MEQGATAHLLDDPLARAPKLPAPLDAWTSHSVGLTRIVLVAPQKDGARLIVVDGPATPNKLRLLGPAGEPDADDFAEVPGGDALCAGGGKVKGAWPCAGKDGAVIVWATSAAGRGWEGLWRVRRTGARRLLALPEGTQEVAVVPSPHGLDVRGAGGVSKGGLRLAALIERGSDDGDDDGDDDDAPRITPVFPRAPTITLATYCEREGWSDVCACVCAHSAGVVEGAEPPPAVVPQPSVELSVGGPAVVPQPAAAVAGAAAVAARRFDAKATPPPLTAVDELFVSADGSRAGWRVQINRFNVYEEAETAELWGADLFYGEAPLALAAEARAAPMPMVASHIGGPPCFAVARGFVAGPVQLTRGAGRVADGCCVLTADGSALLYAANRSSAAPITSAHALWATRWPAPGGEPSARPAQLLPARHVEALCWVPSPPQFCATAAGGVAAPLLLLSWTAQTRFRSALLRADAGVGAAAQCVELEQIVELSPAAVTPVTLAVVQSFAGAGAGSAGQLPGLDLCYGAEGPRSYAAVHDGARVRAAAAAAAARHQPSAALTPRKSGSRTGSAEFEFDVDAAEGGVPPVAAAAAAGMLLLPQPCTNFEEFDVELVEWEGAPLGADGGGGGGDGGDDGADGGGGGRGPAAALHGMLCRAKGTSRSASVLVHAHGGPAISVPRLRSMVASRRYHYAPLLAAGYQVFVPCFRGTLGFGDAFARANVNTQGRLDLEDILSGIDAMLASGAVACGERVGIYGGSYGGYMSMRALATTRRFKAAVAQYGFVHNRWMSYETADFTYEDEYLGCRESWPVHSVPSAQAGDVFDHLHRIDAPCLFLHGLDDDVCPPSQSRVAFNMLRSRGVPTGLIEYPGEGHGFDKPRNQQDRDRRLLLWFLIHLPPAAPGGDDVEMRAMGEGAPPREQEVEMVVLRPLSVMEAGPPALLHVRSDVELSTLGGGEELQDRATAAAEPPAAEED